MRDKVICLMGPTATGKTDLAMRLADIYPIDIISVDSAMVYKGMDIGTAKPSRALQKKYPHALIDLLDPAEQYSAGQFCEDALKAISRSLEQDRIPLLVGGTLLYFNLLQRGFSDFPSHDPKIREMLSEQMIRLGVEKMHAQLCQLDPEIASYIKPQDRQRISRALEIYYATGVKMSELQRAQEWKKHPFTFVNIVLMPLDRKKLHERILKRLDIMLEQGFVEEVRGLYQRADLNDTLPAMRMVGYRQVWAYLSSQYEYEEMRLKILYATRQLAKRQITWLQQWKGRAEFFDPEDEDLFSKVVAVFSEPDLPRDFQDS